MKHISRNFSTQWGDRNIDYDKFRKEKEEGLKLISKNFVNFSCGDLKMVKFDLKNNKANVSFGYNCKGLYLNEMKDLTITKKKRVDLVKEDDSWRITSW